MNYIYDILLDFNDILYDFFDWNEEDKITHIRKIPVFKVSPNNFTEIKNNKVKLGNNFLEKIKDKTEVFESHKVKIVEYACLISNGLEVFAITFDKKGNSYKYSNLLLDENEEVIEVCERLEETNIDLKLINKNNEYLYLTRKDIDIINYIYNEINKLRVSKELDKVKYLYYELFDEKDDNINMMIDRIKGEIENTKSNFYLKIYNFFKLTSLKK